MHIMAKFFWGKQKEVESLIVQYCQKYKLALDLYVTGMKNFLENQDRGQLAIDVKELHIMESQADDIQSQISKVLYGSSLFPESRGDILKLVESLDAVINKSESALRMIYHQYIEIPDQFNNDYSNLVEATRECTRALRKATEFLFDKYQRASDYNIKVDQLESRVDVIEFTLIEKIFSSDLDLANKMLLRDLVANISNIADRAEGAADLMQIMLIKRKL